MKIFRSLFILVLSLVMIQAVEARPLRIANDNNILAFFIVLNQNEIAAAILALTKDVPEIVHDYAYYLKHQHSQNLKETGEVLDLTKIAPMYSSDVLALKKNGAAELYELSKLDDMEFAKAYIDAMIKGHRAGLSILKSVILPIVKNPILKEHAARTSEHVAHHLEKAIEIKSELENS